jgi:hypothetical protein
VVCGAVRRGGAVGTYLEDVPTHTMVLGQDCRVGDHSEPAEGIIRFIGRNARFPVLRPTKGPVCAGPDSAYSLDCIGPNRSVPDGLCLGPDRMRATVQ